MGDRGNVEVVGRDGSSIFFYSHWGASHLATTVAEALNSEAGRARRSDDDYLNRIIFCRMITAVGGSLEDETGFGIGTEPAGDAWLRVVIDHRNKTVRVIGHNAFPEMEMSFDKFIVGVGVAIGEGVMV